MLSNIPYGCTSVGLFIYLLKVSLVVSKLWQLLNHRASLQPLELSFKLFVKTSRTLPGSTTRWRMVCGKCVFSSARMAVLSPFSWPQQWTATSVFLVLTLEHHVSSIVDVGCSKKRIVESHCHPSHMMWSVISYTWLPSVHLLWLCNCSGLWSSFESSHPFCCWVIGTLFRCELITICQHVLCKCFLLVLAFSSQPSKAVIPKIEVCCSKMLRFTLAMPLLAVCFYNSLCQFFFF